MCVGQRVDQLHIDPDLIAGLLHTAFEDVSHPELLRDIGQIFRSTLETLCGCAGNHFEVRHFREPRQNLVLHAFGEIGIAFLLAQTFKRQYGNRFLRNRRSNRRDCDRIVAPVQGELVGQQQHDRQYQNRDDPSVEFLAGLSGDGLVRRDLALALEAVRCPFVEPGKHHRKRKPDRRRDDDPAHNPLSDVEEREDLGRYLHQQPRTRCVERGGPENIAALEFGEA